MLNKVEEILKEKIKHNASNLGLDISEINNDTEILKSGIIDSIEFVDLLTSIENETNIPVDYFVDDENKFFISINWFLNKIKKKNNEM